MNYALGVMLFFKKVCNFASMKHLLLLLTVFSLCAWGQDYCKVSNEDGLVIIELPENGRLEFTTQRPSSDALLCIPAAFITPEGGIQGAYMIDGQMHGRYNRHSKVSLNGRSFTVGSTFTTHNGFQQMCLVRNHQPVHFRDESHRVRRALCKVSQDSPAIIIESKQSMTMNEFAKKLSQRVQYAVYTDMGSHGYGWYYASEHLSHLSYLYFYKRIKQNNWLVFRRN